MNQTQDSIIVEPTTNHQASVIWLHGLGADGYDFVPIVNQFNLPTALGIKFIFPHAPIMPVTINAGMKMRAWFDIVALDISGPADEKGIRKTEQKLNQLISNEIESGIVSEKIILAGFSQGGAMALHCGLRYPKKLGGIIGLSTFLPLYERVHLEANPANKNVSIFMSHGTQDPIVPFQFGELTRNYLTQLKYSVNWYTYPMQHEVCSQEILDVKQWLLNQFGFHQ